MNNAEKSALMNVSELFFPSDIKCIACSAELSHDADFGFCDKCRPKINEHFCLRCGRGIENLSDYCESCKSYPQNFDKARSPYVFDDIFRPLIHRFKYGREKYLAKYFAQMLYRVYQDENFEADIITYVPLHPIRERKRGYNQAKLIADELSKFIAVPVCALLQKDKHTKNMAKLDAKQRSELIKDSFLLCETDQNWKSSKILLIDDVFTTGATANECARMIKMAKVKSVYVLTLTSLAVKPRLFKQSNKAQKIIINK